MPKHMDTAKTVVRGKFMATHSTLQKKKICNKQSSTTPQRATKEEQAYYKINRKK
jgi:hypothetical protein